MDFGLAEFEQRLPDADSIRTLAVETMSLGERAHELMDSVGGTWLKLTAPEIYSVTGNEKVFTALDASRTKIEALSNSTIQIDTLMRTYADSVDWLRLRMEAVKDRIAEFHREFPESEKDEWDNDSVAVRARNLLADDVGRLHSDLDEDQRETAARISHITDSGRVYAEYNSYDPEFQAYLRPDEIIYGNAYEDYAEALSGGDLSKDLPWYRDTINFMADTVRGVPKAGWEFVTDLGVLIGYDGWDNAGAAWTSMGRMGVNVVIAGSPDFFDAERTRQALDELALLGTELIRMDQWQSDRPGYALGGNIFDIGSLFLGGAGVAAGTTKAGTKAAGFASRLGNASGWRRSPNGPGSFGGLVPALPDGQVPVTLRPFEVPDNATMNREGKGSAGGKAFSGTYSPNGRDPEHQPQVGDADGGNGSFQDVSPRSINGAPEQQYITGIDRVHDTQAREYVLPRKDGTVVSFDGHTWRGDPPKEYFTEVKGHLDFLDNIKPALLTKRLEEMVERELVNQIDALRHGGTPGYVHEWVFTEKVVMDTFEQVMRRYPQLRGQITVRYEPMP